MIQLKQKILYFTLTHNPVTGHSSNEYTITHNQGKYPSLVTATWGSAGAAIGNTQVVQTVQQDVTPTGTRGMYSYAVNDTQQLIRMYNISSYTQEVKVRLTFD